MQGYKLVEEVKKKGIYTTDNQVATALGIGRANISNLKNRGGNVDAKTALKLADMAELTPKEALKLMEQGFIDLSLLIVTALSAIALHKPILKALYCILCKIISTKKFSNGANDTDYDLTVYTNVDIDQSYSIVV